MMTASAIALAAVGVLLTFAPEESLLMWKPRSLFNYFCKFWVVSTFPLEC